MRKRGCLFWGIALPIALLVSASLGGLIWVKSIIADDGLDGRHSIICISARDRAKYDVDNPPQKIVDRTLVSMLEFHDFQPRRAGFSHLRGSIIYFTLKNFWTPAERRALYRGARPTLRDCRE